MINNNFRQHNSITCNKMSDWLSQKIKEEKSKKEDARYLKKIKSAYVSMASALAAVHRWEVGEDPEDKR